MKLNIYNLSTCIMLSVTLFTVGCFSNQNSKHAAETTLEEEKDGYDSPRERYEQEFEKTKDPALGYVPSERLLDAINYTEQLKNSPAARTEALDWTERGPNFDSVGPSNGNGRGAGAGVTPAGTYTAGRIRAIMIDQSDPTGNTVFTGGIQGGLWKTTNFISANPQWTNINDYFDNMGISSICQNPANPDIMYFSTGEPITNLDAVLGKGVYKSINHGATWTLLPSTTAFNRNFKILCDAAGNVYIGRRAAGISRSSDGGTTWVNISPAGYSGVSGTDFEFSNTGRLHLSLGYGGGATYFYHNTPATATNSGWIAPASGLPTVANRMDVAVEGNFVYLAPTNASDNIYGAFLSTDGGQNFRQKQAFDYPTGVSNTQGWYNICLDINPANPAQIMVGGLDIYLSVDSGENVSRLTRWVSTPPYVHADQHYLDWHQVGSESRVLVTCDGGVFFSQTGGTTFSDKNKSLNIKQFYSVAVHPTLPFYLLAGAQDNGVHQLKYEGLGPSVEVTGGDGCYTHINQLNPQIQFGSYVYGAYRRSINGGANWTSINLYPNNGLFINPWDYDDSKNIMYATYGTNSMMRWINANTTTSTASTALITLAGLGTPTAFKVSPQTANRVYVGSSSGRIFRIDNADTVTNSYISNNIFDISLPSSGYVQCVNVGANENNMVAVVTNYGTTNVWVTTNGGLLWTGIDGNLPDMPVRWAVFQPGDDDKLLIATEAGVYRARDINGTSTQWMPSPGFPTVRTDMLKVRTSDNLVAAATHGRGLFTANILSVIPIRDVTLNGSLGTDGKAVLNWTAVDATNNVRYHLEYSTDGVNFVEIADLNYATTQFRHNLSAKNGYYRIRAVEPNQRPIYSNIVVVKNTNAKGLQIQVLPNPVSTSGNFIVSGSTAGNYVWEITDVAGRTIDKGQGVLAQGGSRNHAINVSKLKAGRYSIRIIQENDRVTTSFIKH